MSEEGREEEEEEEEVALTSSNDIGYSDAMYVILRCQSQGDTFLARIEYRDDDPFRFWTLGTKAELPPASTR